MSQLVLMSLASAHSGSPGLAQLVRSVLSPVASLAREAGGCRGRCDNILLCRIQGEAGRHGGIDTDDITSGGQVIEDRGACTGLLSVCCQLRGQRARARHHHPHHHPYPHHHHGSSPSLAELIRIPRQLAQDNKARQVTQLLIAASKLNLLTSGQVSSTVISRSS